jgi:hypothetical protein
VIQRDPGWGKREATRMTKRNLGAWHVVYLNTFDGRRRGYCIIDMTIEVHLKRQPRDQHRGVASHVYFVESR